MIESHCHRREWIEEQRQRLGVADAEILERAIFALTLLDGLSRTGLEFVFKGGTALLLHLPRPLRLSIDIDIICEGDRAFLEPVLDGIVNQTPFFRWEEQERGADRLPRRLHYKLYYRSPILGGEERPIILDVVTEKNKITDLIEQPIRTSFIETDKAGSVMTPSVNALLGDKLTAFAPNTVGVPLNERYSLQVIKQLFDIAQLYDVITDPDALASANLASFEAESGYRFQTAEYEDYLSDTVATCFQLCSLDLRGYIETEETRLLRRGVTQLANHLIDCRFRIPQAKVAAAKAACLASLLKNGGMPERLPRFDGLEMNVLAECRLHEDFAVLEKLKEVGPEAYFYWTVVE